MPPRRRHLQQQTRAGSDVPTAIQRTQYRKPFWRSGALQAVTTLPEPGQGQQQQSDGTTATTGRGFLAFGIFSARLITARIARAFATGRTALP